MKENLTKDLFTYINENEDSLREIIETQLVSKLDNEARYFKSHSDSFTTIYIDVTNGEFHVYEWTDISSRPLDENLVSLISIKDDIVEWGEENTFANYLNIWYDKCLKEDTDETELAELYPDLFEEYVHEGIQYAIACVDIDSIIAEIKENAWEAY